MTLLNQTDPQAVRRVLSNLLDNLGNLHLACEAGPTEPGIHCGPISSPASFITTIRGRSRFQIREDGTIKIVNLKKGDFTLRLCNTWLTHVPDHDYLTLGGRIEMDRFLFFFAQPIASGDGSKQAKHYVDIHKSPYLSSQSPHHAAVTTMVHALTQLGDGPTRMRLARDISHCIIQCMHDSLDSPAMETVSSKAKTTFAVACSFIDEHCCQNISRDDVARALQIHPSHVSRLFTHQANRSFNQYLIDARLKRAHDLLAEPSLSIAQIAGMCGFGSPGYFTRLYRQAYGQRPGDRRVELFES